jgi:hypothetical protein
VAIFVRQRFRMTLFGRLAANLTLALARSINLFSFPELSAFVAIGQSAASAAIASATMYTLHRRLRRVSFVTKHELKSSQKYLKF